MIKRSRSRMASWAIALSGVALAGCGGAVSEQDGDLAADANDPLYANRSVLWPNAGTGRVDINVCWENPRNAPGETNAAKAAWRDARRAAIQESWSRVARVNFYGWDGGNPVNNPRSCANRAPGLHVVICNLPTDARCPGLPRSQSQPIGRLANGVSNSIRLNPQHPPSIAVHEFGHALGFYHEEERPDAPNGVGPCAKQTAGNSNPATYGAYDPNGIMSYCTPPVGPPWLSPNDVASFQRFYGGRKTFSLVSPRAHCASAHYATGDGDPFFVWDCDESHRDQELLRRMYSDASNLYLLGTARSSTARCMVASSATNGADVRLGTCSNSSGWLFQQVRLRGFGGLCLDLKGGFSDGSPIQMRKCGDSFLEGDITQRWNLTHAGQIKPSSNETKCAKLVAGRLQLAACDLRDSAQLFLFEDGRIKRRSNNMCLDVYGPSDAQFTAGSGMPWIGTFIQEFRCNGSLNQRWHINGAIRSVANPDLCLNRAGDDSNGTPVKLASCNGLPWGTGQEWDYYF